MKRGRIWVLALCVVIFVVLRLLPAKTITGEVRVKERPSVPRVSAEPLWGADEAIHKLMEGNRRYMEGHTAPDVSSQSPFAVIVACSDSRVTPEIIFNQGLGDLFVVRVAGSVIGPLELESINFAIDALGASVVMVLGHQNCGAVQAVLAGETDDIQEIARLIKPALKSRMTIENAVKANVCQGVRYLRGLEKVDVIGGYYDFVTGKVEILNCR